MSRNEPSDDRAYCYFPSAEMPRLLIGFYGSLSGELAECCEITWEDKNHPVMTFNLWGWARFFEHFKDLGELLDDTKPAPADVLAMLKICGIRDMTHAVM